MMIGPGQRKKKKKKKKEKKNPLQKNPKKTDQDREGFAKILFDHFYLYFFFVFVF